MTLKEYSLKELTKRVLKIKKTRQTSKTVSIEVLGVRSLYITGDNKDDN
jgi:hypothetical protein